MPRRNFNDEGTMQMKMKTLRWMTRWIAGPALACALWGAAAAEANGPWAAPKSGELDRFYGGTALPANPFLASGVATGSSVEIYTAAGTGPAALNAAAPGGTPERYIDYPLLQVLFPDFNPTPEERAIGVLPPGMTITEAQGLNTMERVKANLELAGLTLDRILFMRIYLDNPPGSERADYNGWNRAYRKHMANVDLVTGEVIAAYQPVLFENPTRPARSNLEVATLPVAGWLVEIEVTAAFPPYFECFPPYLCVPKKK